MPPDPIAVEPVVEVGHALWQYFMAAGGGAGGSVAGLSYLVYKKLLKHIDEQVENSFLEWKKRAPEEVSAQVTASLTSVTQEVALQSEKLSSLSTTQQRVQQSLKSKGKADARHETEIRTIRERLDSIDSRAHDNQLAIGKLETAMEHAQRSIDNATRGIQRLLERNLERRNP